MDTFTFEKESVNISLETYEWDNVWWEHAPDSETPRVLYIGDSISCGTRHPANEVAGGELLFDGFGTSKALDNPSFKDSLRLFARQQRHRCAVLFNNGLHGWHLEDEEYCRLYGEMLDFLISEFPGTALYPVLTTQVINDPDTLARVLRRNEIVLELAAQRNLTVIDLYAVSVEIADCHEPDNVHFNQLGYRRLAEKIVEFLKNDMASHDR